MSRYNLPWSPFTDGEQLDNFDDQVAKRRRDLRWAPAGVEYLDEEAMEAFFADPEKSVRDFQQQAEASKRPARRDWRAENREHLSQARLLGRKPHTQGERVGEEPFLAEARILYARHVFLSRFEIALHGMVTMTEDNPLTPELPLLKRMFHPQLPIMLLGAKREIIDAETFRRRILEREKAVRPSGQESDAPRDEIEDRTPPLRIDGDLDLRAVALRHPLALKDVEIDGDLILDDAQHDTTMRLEDVKIRGRLQARNYRCKAGAVMPSLRVYGIHGRDEMKREKEAEDGVAVSFNGAFIESTMDLENARIDGGLDLSDLDAKGTVLLSGVHIDRREPLSPGAGRFGCTLDGARIGRDVRVAPTLRDAKTGAMRSARIVGGLSAVGAEIGGKLDLTSLQCLASPEPRLDAANLSPGDRALVRQASGERDPRLAFSPKLGRVFAVLPKGRLGNLNLESASIDGRLLMRVNGDRPRIEGSASLDGMIVGGAVEFVGIHVDGSFLARRSRLEQGAGFLVYEQSGKIVTTEIGEVMSFDGATLRGSLELGGARIGGGLVLNAANVSNNVDLRTLDLVINDQPLSVRSQIGRQHGSSVAITADAAEIGGHLSFSGAVIDGDINCLGARIDGILDGDPSPERCWRTEIAGDVALSGATIKSDTRFCGARISGALTIITGSVGRLQMRCARVRASEDTADIDLPPRPTSIGGAIIQSANAISIDFYGIQVSRGAAPNDDTQPVYAGAIEIHGVTLTEGLEFFKNNPERYLNFGVATNAAQQLDPRTVRASIAGGLRLRQFTCGGDLVLSNMNVGETIEMTQVRIAGNLFAASLLPGDEGEASLALEADRIDMRLLHCDGDADLSGLRLRLSANNGGAPNGLNAEGAVFGGHCAFVDPNRLEQRLHRTGRTLPKARIGDLLNLSSITAERLSLSGASLEEAKFRDPADAAWERGALLLERAEIGHLVLVHPLPRKPDLADLSVAKWDYFDERRGETGSSQPLHIQLQLLLSRSRPFNRAIYSSVERSLRDTGDDVAADEVYRRMRWRAAIQEKQRDQTTGGCDVTFFECLFATARGLFSRKHGAFWEPLWGAVIGGGTSFFTRSGRLLKCLTLVLLPISLLIFPLEENITPSTFLLSESASGQLGATGKTREDRPLPREWGDLERARVIALNHIPIIPLIATPRWEAAENRPLCLLKPNRIADAGAPPLGGAACRDSAWTIDSISPATYALIVRGLHWIAWPLALAGIAATLQRRGR